MKSIEKLSQKTQLKRYFARRVTNQVRLILGIWRQLNESSWSQVRYEDMRRATQTLIRFAQHFNEEAHRRAAREILQCLDLIDPQEPNPSPELLHNLTEVIHNLSQLALRRGDPRETQSPNALSPKKPIYIAFADPEEAFVLSEQLEFFGFRVLVTTTAVEFQAEMESRQPAAILLDVEFAHNEVSENINEHTTKDHNTKEHHKKETGIELLQKCQQLFDKPVKTVMYSAQPADIFTRLQATRAGGCYFHQGHLELGRLVEQLDNMIQLTPPSPFRVLIVDDSKSQGAATKKILNNGGLIAEHIIDPLGIFEAIEQYDPEILLLDMYMPSCSGEELAQVIRQLEEFHHIPIIFLSAEDDPEKQASIMGSGGDDFLNKSVEPKNLVAEVKARGYRARAIVDLMYRDSLTGLLNHSRILREMRLEIDKALVSGQSLCFAMVDIDHFKSVNDTYGHAEGDRVIKRLAMFLKQRLRKTDAVGRYGGEEFAVVLPNTTLEDAVIFLNDIRDHYSQFRYSTKEGEFSSTFSCGIAQLTQSNAESITIEADEALYDAKRGGRNRVCTYRS